MNFAGRSPTIELSDGPLTNIPITRTASDGITKKSYAIKIKRVDLEDLEDLNESEDDSNESDAKM